MGDFHRHLDSIPTDGRRLVAFLGGTIGNLTPAGATPSSCSTSTARWRRGDSLLIGTDLVKDRGRLVAAYDDAAGVTAAFNRNVLSVLNRELGATFDPDPLRPRGACGTRSRRGSRCGCVRREEQAVTLDRLGIEISFERRRGAADGDQRQVHPPAGRGRAVGGRLRGGRHWGAEDGEFLLTLASPYC